MVTVEAQACGTPVLAYGQGGSREIVRDGETGIFFAEQSVASIIEAVRRFEASRRAMLPPGLPPERPALQQRVFREAYTDFVNREVAVVLPRG